MADDSNFNTVTMAKVFAGQGLYDKAAEIYRKLLEQDPERSDLIDAISDLERSRLEKEKELKKSLLPLFFEWFDLALSNNRIELLDKLGRRR
jgi:tetratricopeptide (TPR) repeat protein